MHQLLVGGLKVDVVRKNIKNLHLGVYPPEGRVRVAAPLRIDDEAIRLAIISKLSWIKRQQSRFLAQERQSKREFIYRESHYVFGSRYLLNVIEQNGHSHVELLNKTRIDLYVPVGSGASKREQVLTDWYRRELKVLIPPFVSKWEEIMGYSKKEIIGKSVIDIMPKKAGEYAVKISIPNHWKYGYTRNETH